MADSVKAGIIKDRLKKASDSVRGSFGMNTDEDDEEEKKRKKAEEEAEGKESTPPARKALKGFLDLSKSFRDSWK
jgi:hypothetical protein